MVGCRMTRTTIALIALALCCAALLFMAMWGARRTHNVGDFFLASRRMGLWLAALSHTANASPLWLLFVLAGAAFAWGLAAIWIWLAVVLGYALNTFWIAPRLRQLSVRQHSLTLIQALSMDAGDRLQPLIVRSAALIVSIALLLEISAVLSVATSVFVTDFGFDASTAAITAMVVIVTFVLAGGYWAASLADAAALIAVLLIVLVAPLMALAVYDGADQLRAGFDALGPQARDWFGGRSAIVAVAFVAGVSAFGFDLFGQPHAASRLMAVRDEAALARLRWLTLPLIGLLLAFVLLTGWSASLLYGGLRQPELALIAMIERMLPPAVSAILLCVLLAALLTSIGNRLLVLAACLSTDLRRSASMLAFAWARVVLVLYAIAALCLSLYAGTGVLDQALFAFTALGASFGPLLLVRLSGKRVRPGSTLGALWAGFSLTALFHLLPDSPGDFLERVMPFVTALGIALSGGERRRNPDRADRAEQTVHDRVPI
jgi:sodium/proline symporter